MDNFRLVTLPKDIKMVVGKIHAVIGDPGSESYKGFIEEGYEDIAWTKKWHKLWLSAVCSFMEGYGYDIGDVAEWRNMFEDVKIVAGLPHTNRLISVVDLRDEFTWLVVSDGTQLDGLQALASRTIIDTDEPIPCETSPEDMDLDA